MHLFYSIFLNNNIYISFPPRISDVKDLEGLLECQSISILDLSDNNIPDTQAGELIDLLSKMPNLRVLRMVGNPVVRTRDYNYRFI